MNNMRFIDKYIILKNNVLIDFLDDNKVDKYNNYSILSKDISLHYNMYAIPIFANIKNSMDDSLMINT